MPTASRHPTRREDHACPAGAERSTGPDGFRYTPGPRSGLLADERLARNVGVPVHERAIGVVLPRPDMQSVERREPEAIGALEQMKKLSHKLWRSRMRFVPRIGENQIVGADQAEVPAWGRLVDHDLGTGGVQDAAVHQVSVYVVEPHCPGVGAAHAAELKGIPLRLSHGHVLESLGRFPDNSQKVSRIVLLIQRRFVLWFWRMRMAILRQGARRAHVHEKSAEQRQTQDARV